MLMLDVLIAPQQETHLACPRPVFRARCSTPSGLGCAAARYAHLRSASPRRGGGRGRKDNLQKDFYTPAKGDKIKIYKPIEKRNKKGAIVATTYEPVAEIVLTKVQKDKSMGELSGSEKISEDYAATDANVDVESLL